MDLNLAGTVALTTSSSSGLGKASATSLAREGVNVVVNGRNKERLESTVEEIREVATGEVIGHAGDITNADDISALVDLTIDEFGQMDHLVTSAGGPPKLQFYETTDEQWYDSYDLLVMSVVRVVREATPHLKADGGGSIVNITSRTVKEASPSNVLSSSVRMAVPGLEKVLSNELAPEIRVNTVLPGSIETQRIYNGWDKAIKRGEIVDYDEGRARRAATIPLGRLGKPDEFGDTVAFLCSERAGFITGVALPVEGGSGSSTL